MAFAKFAVLIYSANDILPQPLASTTVAACQAVCAEHIDCVGFVFGTQAGCTNCWCAHTSGAAASVGICGGVQGHRQRAP